MFNEGDLVLRKIEASGVGEQGKLAPNYEGPYKVKAMRGPGAYNLGTMEGSHKP